MRSTIEIAPRDTRGTTAPFNGILDGCSTTEVHGRPPRYILSRYQWVSTIRATRCKALCHPVAMGQARFATGSPRSREGARSVGRLATPGVPRALGLIQGAQEKG